MGTQTIERARPRAAVGAVGVVGYVGAAAFVIAAAWYTLAVRGVTVSSPPQVGPDVPLEQGQRIYYQWMATTLPQERLYTSVAIAGFLCLTGMAGLTRDVLGRTQPLARAGAFLIGAGAVLWVAGGIFQLGGHWAVGLMATHANPIQTVNAIAFTIDTTEQAFALAAFALMGAGMLAFARVAAQARPRRRGWAACTALLAALMFAISGSYAAGDGSLTDVMLLIGGIVLLPSWLLWTGHIGRAQLAVTPQE